MSERVERAIAARERRTRGEPEPKKAKKPIEPIEPKKEPDGAARES